MCKAILLIHQKLWILDKCTTEALNRTQQELCSTWRGNSQILRDFEGMLNKRGDLETSLNVSNDFPRPPTSFRCFRERRLAFCCF